MNKDIKVLRILFPITYSDLTNLPMGLEILYVPHTDIKEDSIVNLNLPPTLNILYLNHTLVNNVIVPYGCKIKGVVQQRKCKVLKELKSQYNDNEILSINKFKQFYKTYVRRTI